MASQVTSTKRAIIRDEARDVSEHFALEEKRLRRKLTHAEQLRILIYHQTGFWVRRVR